MEAIAQLLKVKTSTPLLVQNFFFGKDYEHGGETYAFMPFQFEGATVNISGDNESSTLLLPNINMLLSALFLEDGWRGKSITVTTMWLDANNYSVAADISPISMSFLVEGVSFNDSTIEVRLRSPIDAATSEIPVAVLSQDLVGRLPIAASLRLT